MSDTETEIEVEVVDDTPEKDRGRPRRQEGAQPYDVSDDDISKYSETVQGRIKRLRFEFHEERRLKEAADRERSEAVNLAQRTLEENRKLHEYAVRTEKIAMDAAKRRAEAELQGAKRAARDAYEAGDTGKAVDLQADIAKYAVEAERFANYTPPEPRAEPKPQPERKAPDAKAMKWARDNDWFGPDKRMTGYAYGVHEELVSEGVDPRGDEYYSRLDTEMRKQFPDRFEADEAAPPRKPTTVVAPAGRSVKTARKVQLSASQVALAGRLGLTVEQYAAELIKANPNG